MNTQNCHCRKNKVAATIQTLDGQAIAKGVLKLEVSPGRGAFYPILDRAVQGSIDCSSYPEVVALVGTRENLPKGSHQHSLKNWWFHVGLSHPGGLPDDPYHFQ